MVSGAAPALNALFHAFMVRLRAADRIGEMD
jgi:hypothetical protein